MLTSIRPGRAIALPCALTLFVACHWGTRPRNFQPAQTAMGAWIAVRMAGAASDRVGELYAADADGIVLLLEKRIARMPWGRIAAMDVHELGDAYDVPPGVTPDSAHIARIAAVSRFPQGLHGELLRRVLEALEQDTVDRFGTLTLDSLARRAERNSARFQDRRVAMADGYRRIGADFPGMGEHWVNPAALLQDVIDPERPSFLSYVTIAGEARLLGVGFIATTASGGPPPGVPGFAEHWHEHSGLLAEESGARLAHEREPAITEGGSRVWVLHVWTTLPNPDGQFAADNWALPFFRAGLPAPTTANPDAARAFSLAGAERGDEFLRAILSDAGLRTTANSAATDSIITGARETAARIAARVAHRGRPDAESLGDLRQVWRDMTAALQELLGAHASALLAPPHRPRGHLHAGH